MQIFNFFTNSKNQPSISPILSYAYACLIVLIRIYLLISRTDLLYSCIRTTGFYTISRNLHKSRVNSYTYPCTLSHSRTYLTLLKLLYSIHAYIHVISRNFQKSRVVKKYNTLMRFYYYGRFTSLLHP